MHTLLAAVIGIGPQFWYSCSRCWQPRWLRSVHTPHKSTRIKGVKQRSLSVYPFSATDSKPQTIGYLTFQGRRIPLNTSGTTNGRTTASCNSFLAFSRSAMSSLSYRMDLNAYWAWIILHNNSNQHVLHVIIIYYYRNYHHEHHGSRPKASISSSF